MPDRCAVQGCRADADLVYLDYPVCNVHWDQPADALQRALGITVAEPATSEDSMTEKTKNEIKNATTKKSRTKTEAPVAPIPAEAAPAEPPAPEKAAKAKREKSANEPLKTFAIRIPESKSAALHQAAGKAAASRTVRALIDAFICEDRAAFEQIVEDARKLRA
jgi:hypothetical protein